VKKFQEESPFASRVTWVKSVVLFLANYGPNHQIRSICTGVIVVCNAVFLIDDILFQSGDICDKFTKLSLRIYSE